MTDADNKPAVVGQVEPTVRQHTERARRAAAVLYERGWSVGESEGKSCHRCGYDTVKGGRYCYNCGEPLHAAHGDDTLQDLEAAIAAAVDGVA